MTPTSLPAILADIAAGGLIAVGILGIAAPLPLAASFGLPLRDRSAAGFVRALAARDLALGAVVLAASLRGEGIVLLIAIAAGLLISLGDFAISFFGGDRELHRQHVTHIGGAVAFAVILAILIPTLQL